MPGGRYGWGGFRRSQNWQANQTTVTRQPRPALPGSRLGAYPESQDGRPSRLLVPPDGGVTYDKTGIVVADLAASGVRAVTAAETGLAVASRVGSGVRVSVAARTGGGVSARAASGAAAREFSKTGATGGYPIPGPGLLPSETLILGLPGVKLVASGAGQSIGSTYLKAGKGVTACAGSGADSVTAVEGNQAAGALPSATLLPSGGPIPSTDLLPGVYPGEGALLPASPRSRVSWGASGVSRVERLHFGAGVTERSATGSRVSAFGETGAGGTERSASGTVEIASATFSETAGAGESAWEASGVSEYTAGSGGTVYNKAGDGAAEFKASGPRAGFLWQKTGLSELWLAGGGADQSISAETGVAVRTADASGPDSSRFTETAVAAAALVASGDGTVASVETGSVETALAASGADAVVFAETGAASTVREATGGDIFTAQEQGAGITAWESSGYRVISDSEAGTGILAGVASGTASGSLISGGRIYVATGVGQARRVGSGTDAFTSGHAGLAQTTRDAAGDGAIVYAETGTATSVRAATGETARVFGEAGTGTTARVASGDGTSVYGESGTGASPRTATGNTSRAFSETGASAATRAASGTRTVVYVETGKGVETWTVSGGWDKVTVLRRVDGDAGISGIDGASADLSGGLEVSSGTSLTEGSDSSVVLVGG